MRGRRPRGQTPLAFAAQRDFRAGTGGWSLGTLFEGSARLEVWSYPSCGHVEFFVPGVGE